MPFSIFSASLLTCSLSLFEVNNNHFPFFSVRYVSSIDLIPGIWINFSCVLSFIPSFEILWIGTTAIFAREFLVGIFDVGTFHWLSSIEVNKE